MYYLLSILLGLIPDILYFTLFFIYTKRLSNNKIKLFLLLSLAYFICILIQQWQIIYYIVVMVLFYIVLKLLYKKKVQIIDMFIISISCFWITFVSFICMLFVKNDMSNYVFISIIARIILFLPFIFRNKFNLIYKKYCKYWNRNDKQKKPIKSITLRNISVIALNIIILFMNITISNIIYFIK